MAEIKYQFSSEKFIQALAYLAAAGLPQLSKLKVAKLLYFCDKYHLLKYGRPVMGDVYFCLENGPVPSSSLDCMSNAIAAICIKGHTDSFLDTFAQYIEVNQKPKYPEFVSKAVPEMDLFSGSEIEALDRTIEEFGMLSPWMLRRLSHDDPTWIIPDAGRQDGGRAKIPYELFFEGQPEGVKEALKLIEEEQEHTAFAGLLAG